MCLLVHWRLPGRMSEMDPILLSASRIVRAGTVEGSGVQGEEDGRYQMHGRNTTKENGEVVIESRHELQRLDEKQFVYYTISRAFYWYPWYHCIVQFSLHPFQK
jgi:hypothetical protein